MTHRYGEESPQIGLPSALPVLLSFCQLVTNKSHLRKTELKNYLHQIELWTFS